MTATKKKEAVHQPEKKKDKKSIIFKVGKRRTAVAKATAKPGTGKIMVNGEILQNIKNNIVKLRIQEVFLVTEKDDWKAYDFTATAKGGGVMGQTDAMRQAFARCVVEIFPELRQKFLEYDRNLLVYDPRRTEPHKPPHSSWGPRRYKQRSKR